MKSKAFNFFVTCVAESLKMANVLTHSSNHVLQKISKTSQRLSVLGVLCCLPLSPLHAQSILPTMTPVSVSLKWTHQFQFAGYYMAKQQGYYQQAGLDVSFLEAEPSIDPIQRVLQGQAQFGVGTSDLIQNRVQGEPVVVLGVIFQHSPIGVATLNPEIKHLEDLRNRKVMIEENSAELFATLQKQGLQAQDLILHRHRLSVQDLIAGKVDGMSIYKTTELADLQQANLPYKVFYPLNFGIDFYGDNLFTTEAMVQDNLELVEAFRQASFRGWQYAMTNQEETIRHILSEYVTDRSYEQLQFEAKIMEELLQPERIYPGNMTEMHWKEIAKTYQELGFIDAMPDFKRFLYQPEVKVAEIQQKLVWVSSVLMLSIALLLAVLYLFKRIHTQKSEFRSLVRQAPLSVLVLNQRGDVLQWNTQAEQTFGWSEAEVLGKNVYDFLVTHEDVQAVRTLLQQTAQDNRRLQIINRNQTKCGQQVTCSWTNSLFGEPGSGKVICMAFELSDLMDDLEEGQEVVEALPSAVKSDQIKVQNSQAPVAQESPEDEPDKVYRPLENSGEQLDRALLAEIMVQSMFLWETQTTKSKVDLAEESRIWRVTLDGGSAKTRTLDKYFSVETMPKNPRWRKVIQTAYFVLKVVPESDYAKKLQGLLDAFNQSYQP